VSYEGQLTGAYFVKNETKGKKKGSCGTKEKKPHKSSGDGNYTHTVKSRLWSDWYRGTARSSMHPLEH
jgi:hypothetical protein